MTSMRHRSWARVVAWLLAGLTACALAAALVLVALNVSRGGVGRTVGDALLAVAIGVGAATSQLIISRRPGNAIGWLLGVGGLSLAGSMLGEQYALYGLATAPGSLPAARTAGWAAGVLASVTVLLLAFLILLFPDGRLPSRRWRPVLWALMVVAVGWVAAQFQAGTTVTGGITNATSAAGITYTYSGIFPHQGWVDSVGRGTAVLGVAAGYDAEHTVAAFAARLKDAPDLDSIRHDLAGAVDQALEPAHISVWISQQG